MTRSITEILEEMEWLSDADGPGGFTDEAYRAMPGQITRLLSALRKAIEQRDALLASIYDRPDCSGPDLSIKKHNAELAAILSPEEK